MATGHTQVWELFFWCFYLLFLMILGPFVCLVLGIVLGRWAQRLRSPKE